MKTSVRVEEKVLKASGQVYQALRDKFGVTYYASKDEIISAYFKLATELQFQLNEASPLKPSEAPEREE